MMRIGDGVNLTLILDNFDNFVWDVEIVILSNIFFEIYWISTFTRESGLLRD